MCTCSTEYKLITSHHTTVDFTAASQVLTLDSTGVYPA